MEPDFLAFARAWIARDRRLAELLERNPAAAEPLVARLAEALANRRRKVDDGDGQVTFSIDLSRLDARTGFDAEALDEIARTLQELGPQGDDT